MMRFPAGTGFVDIPIRWFFSDKLPFLPRHTPYGSIQWRGENEKPPGGVGEVVGAARAWVNGKNINPDCCKGPLPQTGGAAVGGPGVYALGFKWEGSGGGMGDGAGWIGPGYTGIGGGLGDGAGSFGRGYTGIGGGLGDGAGSIGPGYTGIGGGLGDGAGSFWAGLAGAGGGLGDGAGSIGPGYTGIGGGLGDGAGSFGAGLAGAGGGLGDGAGSIGPGYTGIGGGLGDGAGSFGAGMAGGPGGGMADGSGDFDSGETVTPGIIVGYGSLTVPSGWLACDGSEFLSATYPTLATILGNSFGAASAGHTKLPDLRSRVMLGAGQGTGLSLYDLGNKAGEEKHTLTTGEMPSHTHAQQTNTHNSTAGGSNLQASLMGGPVLNLGGTTASAGSGLEHENRQPYLAVQMIIKT